MTVPAWVPPQLTQLFNISIGEYGQDYAVPVGTPIYSPVAGIFATQDTGKTAWGKRAFVHVTGGLSFAVGHLTSFAAASGQKISVGQLIGYSGGAASDPSSGVSTGPHVETQFLNAAGQYLNPAPLFAATPSLLQSIFKGSGSSAVAPATPPISTASFSLPNPLQGIGDAFAAAVTGFEGTLARLFWFGLGAGVIALGLTLVFFGDLESGFDKATDAVAKIPGAAAHDPIADSRPSPAAAEAAAEEGAAAA